MKKIIKVLVLALIMLLAYSCGVNNITSDETTTDQYVISKNIYETPVISNKDEIELVEFEVGRDIEIIFTKEMDETSLSTNTVQISRTDTGEIIEIELSYNSAVLTIHPINRFAVNGDIVSLEGIKQDAEYKISFDTDSIEDIYGNTLSSDYSEIIFETEELNYGIYWFGEDGKCQKYIEGVENEFYDSAKPVLMHSHGWQDGTSENDYWMDQPYVVKNDYYEISTINNWLDKGYNAGAWIWGQFADEGEVKDAEAKIWVGDNGQQGMRYMLKDGSYEEYSTDKSVHELFYDEYVSALSDFNGGYIRFTGHSLGNQVVTALADKIRVEIEAGTIDSKYLPNRIALLDPFWSNWGKDYLDGDWTGERSEEAIEKLISNYDVVVEQFKTSGIGGYLVGDDNLNMRKLTAFYRIWPDFISIIDSAIQHGYATDWYYWSINHDIDISNGYIGANESDSNIKSVMNYHNSNNYYWYTSSGADTATPSDDYFSRSSGVSTW